jgi:hypothetical protein
MATKVNYIVSKLSPNVYAAAQQANLEPQHASKLEQLGWTVDKNRKLMQLPADEAQKQFSALDPTVQEKIKFLYPDASYTQPPKDLGDKFIGAAGFALKTAASPLIGIFKAMGVYNRVINTPYLVARQVAQGEELWSKQTFKDAWDGKRVYDNGALDEAINVFGASDVTVAQGLLAGLKPGEIVEQYGKPDAKLLASLQKAYNEPEKFKQVLDAAKYAQVSLGRDVARIMDTKPTKANLHQDYIDGRTKNISGYIDFAYQLAIDPLTYISGGLSKLPMLGSKFMSRGDRLSKQIEQFGSGAVRDIFRENPDIAKLWDEGIGKAAKKVADAPTIADRNVAAKALKDDFAGYDNDEAIDMLVRNKIFDARSAVEYFSQAENVPKLLAGRVDGTQYFRNGIATARNQRRLDAGFGKWVDSQFNPTRGSDVVNKEGEDAFEIFSKVGKEEDKLVAENIVDAKKFWSSMSKKEKLAQKFGRSTQGRQILLGEDAIKTADVVRDTFRQVLPRDLSDFMTYKFINAEANDQIVILRNTYYAIMQRYGLDGHPKGKELIEKTLQSKFGDKEGLAVVEKITVRPDFVDEIGAIGLKSGDDGIHYESSGIIHPFQEAKGVASLNYMEIAETVANIKSKKNLIMAARGATQSHMAGEFVNAWSLLTLFPRLGIRSGIDETMMFLLTAPGSDIMKFLSRRGHSLGKIATRYTGSKSAEGLRSSMGGFLGTRNSEAISYERRLAIRKQVAQDKGISEDLVDNIDLDTAIAREASSMFHGRDDMDVKFLEEGLVHGAHILSSSARSIAGSASLTGRVDREIAQNLVEYNQYDAMLRELDAISGKTDNIFDTRDLAKAEIFNGRGVAVVHFENFIKRFYGNRKVLDGTTGTRTFDPAKNFLENNGLETAADFRKAKEEALANIGIVRNEELAKVIGEDGLEAVSKNISYRIIDNDAVTEFIKMSSRSSELSQRGVSRAEIVVDQVDRILLDMYQTFHGSPNKFNKTLLDAIRSKQDELTEAEIASLRTIPDKTRRATKALTFDEFEKATQGFQPVGRMYSKLDIEGLTDMESIYAKLGNDAFGFMDRQVTEMFRQPAVLIAYTRIRKNLLKVQKDEEAAELARFMTLNGGSGRRSVDALKEDIAEKVTRKYVEIAINQATDTVLKYADNPLIRTNFALSVRNTGRFYRATEDFWRRTYRLKDVAPRVLYRMRLAHIGLNAAGMVYSDAKGDPYVMMPMDDIIFKTVDGTVRALTGNSGFQQPMFNDFTLKLKLANPSFSPDAGMPTLSGPIAALGVLSMKNILGNFGTFGAKTAEELDNLALGNIGEGMDITRALVPASIQKAWTILDKDEKDRQEATAAMQAIAYNASQGNMLPPDATEQEKYEYLKNIRISAHNIIAVRAALGLFAPIAPSMQESVGVPDYLKEVGFVTLRSEFFDLVDAVTKQHGADVQDPYELALATFIGKNPGKLVYTVARDEKTTKVQIAKTKALKDWAISNKNLINMYGEAAFILAPRIGEFDASTYAWLEAADLMKDKSVETYLTDIMIAKDKQAYYNVARDEKAALATTLSTTERKAIIESSTNMRKMLKASNPLLEAALTGGGNEIASEERMLASLEEMASSLSIEVKPGTRSKLLALTSQVRQFIDMAKDPVIRNTENFTQLKRERKMAIEEMIAAYSSADLTVKEANRAVFSAILDYYSRDSYTA